MCQPIIQYMCQLIISICADRRDHNIVYVPTDNIVCVPTDKIVYVPTNNIVHWSTDDTTGWRKLIGSPKLQIIFHQRATKYRALLRKMTYKDKGSYKSSPPCTVRYVNQNAEGGALEGYSVASVSRID